MGPPIDDLVATLTPGTAVAGATLDLEITSPTDVDNLVISVIEADMGKDEEKPGPDSLVARFYGNVASGQFTLVPRKGKGQTPPPNPELNANPGKNAPTVKINFAGASYDVQLPGKGAENGVYELVVTMSATGHKNFRSQAVVYVRDFQFFKAQGESRPVIAILAGTDDVSSQKGFGDAALAFWRRHADAAFDRRGLGLEAVVKFLDKYKDKFGNWGEVNVISHGNLIPIFVRLVARDKREFLDAHQIEESFAADSNVDTSAFQSGIGLDDKSRVVFRACDAGNNPKILEALHKRVFAGACPVFIPKFVQVYQSDGSGESFEEMLLYYHKAQNKPGADLVEQKMKEAFVQTYPDGDWTKERGTFAPHGDALGRLQSFTVWVDVPEASLYKDLSTGTKKSDADLTPELERHWNDKKLADDDRYLLTKHDDWFAALQKKRELKEEVFDSYWVQSTVPKSGSATPKITIQKAGKVTIGSASDNDIVLNAPGVAAHHAEVVIKAAASKADPMDLELAATADLTMKAGPTTFPIPAGGTATGTGGFTLIMGSASVTFRPPQIVWLLFDVTRYQVQRRRALRVFDKDTDYKKRDLVQPSLSNKDHYGSFG